MRTKRRIVYLWAQLASLWNCPFSDESFTHDHRAVIHGIRPNVTCETAQEFGPTRQYDVFAIIHSKLVLEPKVMLPRSLRGNLEFESFIVILATEGYALFGDANPISTFFCNPSQYRWNTGEIPLLGEFPSDRERGG